LVLFLEVGVGEGMEGDGVKRWGCRHSS
jgi:hypothetical protein